MRFVVLASSPYSETGCALAARLSQLGHAPIGSLTLPAWDRSTLIRKVGQWGLRESYRYAASKLGPKKSTTQKQVRNPYLEPFLQNEAGGFQSLNDVGRHYGFPVLSCLDQNSPTAVSQMRRWVADLAIFTGGNILRAAMLKAPRHGVVNSHLALLPEVRGMSSPEWSLLQEVPLGITIHRMESGIDTGPIFMRREFKAANRCNSLSDLRNRMIAEGIEMLAEVVAKLDVGAIAATAQAKLEYDSAYYVMHDRLKAIAAQCLTRTRSNTVAETWNG
jgi:methionyl-tRNA formyltransferase